MIMHKDLQRAMGCAEELNSLARRGDWAQVDGVRETINLLVGRWIDGPTGTRVWGWPACVVDASHGLTSIRGAEYVPADDKVYENELEKAIRVALDIRTRYDLEAYHRTEHDEDADEGDGA